jgi:hypothetical protein
MHRFFSAVIVLLLSGSAPAFAGMAAPAASSKDVSINALIPLATWKKQFEITEGKDRGRVVPLALHRDRTKQGQWVLVFGDYAGIHIHNDPRFGLVMERLDLFKSHSYIVYEPAVAILTADITAGNAIRREASFKMFDIETGKLKRTGRVTHLVKQVSPSRFDTPAGLIDGYFIEIDHRMDMQFAQLDMKLGLGCSLDDGPVFGSGHYTITKLGIFTATKTAAAALSKS